VKLSAFDPLWLFELNIEPVLTVQHVSMLIVEIAFSRASRKPFRPLREILSSVSRNACAKASATAQRAMLIRKA